MIEEWPDTELSGVKGWLQWLGLQLFQPLISIGGRGDQAWSEFVEETEV
jgi:hypothetical protein